MRFDPRRPPGRHRPSGHRPGRWNESDALTLDETPAEQEGDFDASRWALAWFEQHGFAEGVYSVAGSLSKTKHTSVTGLADASILESKRGRVHLLKPDDLSASWALPTDPRLNAWEVAHHFVQAPGAGGKSSASELATKLGGKAEVARKLAYRFYTLCKHNRRSFEAFAFNGLVQSFPEILRLAREGDQPTAEQGRLFERSG